MEATTPSNNDLQGTRRRARIQLDDLQAVEAIGDPLSLHLQLEITLVGIMPQEQPQALTGGEVMAKAIHAAVTVHQLTIGPRL